MKEWIKISDLLFFQEGPGVRNTQYTQSGVKLLNVANLVNGKVDLSTSDRYISEDEAYGRYKHFLCDDGDFIIASSGIKVEYFDRCFGKNQINEIFKNCDVVVSTMPCTEKTKGMIDKDKFALMKDGSSFINVGRGKLVKEDDLLMYIDKFRGVALDVFEEEPLRNESPLWEAENVIVTPHNCWVSDKNTIRVEELMYSNLKKYKEGKQVNNIVNIERGY